MCSSTKRRSRSQTPSSGRLAVLNIALSATCLALAARL
jgi:hypothetical protein